MSPGDPFTFAVIGHNESERLGEALRQVYEAARPGDDVLFVDSASTDGSADVAADLGARVLNAPAGKGRAIEALLATVTTEHVVLLDGDIDRTTTNLPLALRRTVERTGADLVVADFEEPRMPVRHSSRFIWPPLVEALFPEAHGRFGRTPFSGFRALRAGLELGAIPPGFGAETHINLAVAAAGGTVVLEDVGTYWGPIRSKPTLTREVGTAILALAESLGRLDARDRPRWDEWLETIVGIVVGHARGDSAGETPAEHAPDPDYVERLTAAASRALPPTFLRN